MSRYLCRVGRAGGLERTESTTPSMDKPGAIRNRGPGVAAVVLALLLIMCLAESATGSCLSYGHSCWGAHGKRSGRSPVAAPDWYLGRMLRRMTTKSDMDRDPEMLARNDDLGAIFQVAMPDDVHAIANMLSINQDLPVEIPTRTMEAKPMLDDELLSQIKIWQLMRRASEAN